MRKKKDPNRMKLKLDLIGLLRNNPGSKSYQVIIRYLRQTHLYNSIQSWSVILVPTPYKLVAATHQFLLCQPLIKTKKKKNKHKGKVREAGVELSNSIQVKNSLFWMKMESEAVEIDGSVMEGVSTHFMLGRWSHEKLPAFPAANVLAQC